MISKTGKLRSESQGDHPAALIIYEEGNSFALTALNFCFVFFQEKMKGSRINIITFDFIRQY